MIASFTAISLMMAARYFYALGDLKNCSLLNSRGMGPRPKGTSLNRDLRGALAVEAVTAKTSGTIQSANHNHQENHNDAEDY